MAFCGSVEPDDDGELLIVFEELFDLRDGFVFEVVVEAAVLRGVPVTGVFVVIAANGCRVPPGAVQSWSPAK